MALLYLIELSVYLYLYIKYTYIYSILILILVYKVYLYLQYTYVLSLTGSLYHLEENFGDFIKYIYKYINQFLKCQSEIVHTYFSTQETAHLSKSDHNNI